MTLHLVLQSGQLITLTRMCCEMESLIEAHQLRFDAELTAAPLLSIQAQDVARFQDSKDLHASLSLGSFLN